MKILLYSAIISLFLTSCITSTNNDNSATSTLSFGTYQRSETQIWTQSQQGVNATVVLKSQLTLNSDSTFLQQGYATSTDLNWTNQLIIGEKGSYHIYGNTITSTNRLEETLNSTTGLMTAWAMPYAGSTSTAYIQNITSTSFQTSDSGASGPWKNWIKI